MIHEVFHVTNEYNAVQALIFQPFEPGEISVIIVMTKIQYDSAWRWKCNLWQTSKSIPEYSYRQEERGLYGFS